MELVVVVLAAQEIEVRKFLLVQVLGLACDYNENPRIRTYLIIRTCS